MHYSLAVLALALNVALVWCQVELEDVALHEEDLPVEDGLIRERRFADEDAEDRFRREADPRLWGGNRGEGKPDQRGRIGTSGRFRREADPQNKNGGWNVSVNKDQGRGPQVRAEAEKNIYTSPNGKVRVDANGYYEAGRGRKPSKGGGVSVSGRWRREADPQNKNGGGWNVNVNKDQGRGPQVRAEAEKNIYTSPNGKVRVDANGYYEVGRGRKPSKGGGVSVSGRWRREADPKEPESSPKIRTLEWKPKTYETRDRLTKDRRPIYQLRPRPLVRPAIVTDAPVRALREADPKQPDRWSRTFESQERQRLTKDRRPIGEDKRRPTGEPTIATTRPIRFRREAELEEEEEAVL